MTTETSKEKTLLYPEKGSAKGLIVPRRMPRLISAIKNNDEKAVIECIQRGDNVNIFHYKESALSYAVSRSDVQSPARLSIVKLLLENKAKIINLDEISIPLTLLLFLQKQNQGDINVLKCLTILCDQFEYIIHSSWKSKDHDFTQYRLSCEKKDAMEYRDTLNEILQLVPKQLQKIIETETLIPKAVIEYLLIKYDGTSPIDRLNFSSYSDLKPILQSLKLNESKDEKPQKQSLPFFSSKLKKEEQKSQPIQDKLNSSAYRII